MTVPASPAGGSGGSPPRAGAGRAGGSPRRAGAGRAGGSAGSPPRVGAAPRHQVPASGRPLDQITLRGLRVRGRHGVYEHERISGQEFVVDAVLSLDTLAAAATDELSRTVDYGALAAALAGVVSGEPVRLIETLADRLAQVCLAEPAVTEVEITVHKPQAPIPYAIDDVTVTIARRRV
jgi:7,8-dihydroneopterin aldolase/epimerase/oxygenase